MNLRKKKLLILVAAGISVVLVSLFFWSRSGENSTFLRARQKMVKDISLERIKESGKLVMLTENSTVSYYIYRGHKMGFEYEILKEFAKHLGVKLEVRVVDLDEAITKLTKGEGDLIACNLTITRDRKKDMSFSHPFLRTSQVLVQRKPEGWRRMSEKELRDSIIHDPVQLARQRIHVWKNSSYYKRLLALQDEIGDTIFIQGEPGNIQTEDFIQQVAEGVIDYTVVDRNVALINQRFYPNIDVHLELSIKQQIAFGLRKTDKRLMNELNTWLQQFMKTTAYKNLKKKYFTHSEHIARVKDSYSSLGGGRISPYDEIIRREAEKIGWDWRLIASLIYQESRFQSEVESWQGTYGLMQFTPETGARFGVYPDSPPEAQIIGGIKYIKRLFNFWKEIPDSTQRMKFTLASYNAGHGHILDAQRIAKHEQADHLTWDNSVEEYLLKLAEPKYHKLHLVKAGPYRGKHTRNYVREVFVRYEEYAMSFPLTNTQE
jgi:membrane-bound lytic murein transglycosylase F